MRWRKPTLKSRLPVRNQIYQTLVWAAKDGKLQNLKRVLARDIARRESSYRQYEKQSEITPQPQVQSDLDRMMALKDRYEAGERLPAKDYKELMDWQNSTPLREIARQTGVDLPPQNDSLFNGADDLTSVQQVIKQAESWHALSRHFPSL
jgi:hypothetical protein